MTDGCAIDPRSFARTLRDQRRTRMKGGLYHLNQVLMAYNSNRIEGSRLDEEQTRYIYETRTITGENVAVDDVVEAVNSFELFDEMIDRLGEPITAETMKDLSCTGWGGLCFRVGFFVGMVGVGWSFWGTKVAVGSGG